MVKTFINLKLLLLKNSFKRSPWQIVGLIIGLLYGLFIIAALGVAIVATRWLDPETRLYIYVIAGSVFVLGWWIIPTLLSSLDETLDINKFTSLPIKKSQLLIGLTIAGLLSIPAALSVLLLLATWVAWSDNLAAFIVSIVASVLVLLLTQIGARTLASFVTTFFSGRRAKELMAVVALLLLIMFGPSITFISSAFENGFDQELFMSYVRSATEILGWLPFGALWHAPFDALAGNYLFALLRLVYVAAFIALLVWSWSLIITRAQTNPVHEKVKARSSGSWLDSLQKGSISAIAVKTFRYWQRDNRLAVSNIAVLIIPVIFVVLDLSMQNDGGFPDVLLYSLGPFTAAIYGWGLHNMLAYDGSAFWQNLSSGVSGRNDRIGRLIVEGGTGVVLTAIVLVFSIIYTGRFDLAPLLVGTSAGILLASLAVSSLVSVLWIYPVPAPGESPFKTQPGTGTLTMLAQGVSFFASSVLALPSVVIYVVALLVPELSTVLSWISIPVGIGLGVLWLWIGITQGAKRFDQRGPELLQSIMKFS